jgi:hypothetical protein
MCQFSDRPHEVINTAAIIVERLHKRHEHGHHPSVESLRQFNTTKNEQLQTLSAIILHPVVTNDSSNSSNECTRNHNSIHKLVKVFLIINLHQSFSQFLCRGESSSEVQDLGLHCIRAVRVNVERCLNHECSMARIQGVCKGVCATRSTGTPGPLGGLTRYQTLSRLGLLGLIGKL